MAEFTEQIITVVQNYPNLYDLSHPDYKNVRKRDNAWEEIGLKLHRDGEHIKKKWRNLKDSYAKYLRCIQSKTGEVAKRNYKHWQWAKQMEFFRPFLAVAPTLSNVHDTQTKQRREVPEVEEQQEEPVESPPPPLEQLPDTQPIITKKVQKSLKQRQINTSEKSSSVQTVLEYLENRRSRDYRTTNDLIFAGHAKTVDLLSPKRQIITRMKISQIIAEQQLLAIEEMESTSSPSSSNTSHFGDINPKPQDHTGVTRLSTEPDDEIVIFAKNIASQMKMLPKSICKLLFKDIRNLITSKTSSKRCCMESQVSSCTLDEINLSNGMDIGECKTAVKDEMDVEEYKIGVKE